MGLLDAFGPMRSALHVISQIESSCVCSGDELDNFERNQVWALVEPLEM
jgi:hypothetical protein